MSQTSETLIIVSYRKPSASAAQGNPPSTTVCFSIRTQRTRTRSSVFIIQRNQAYVEYFKCLQGIAIDVLVEMKYMCTNAPISSVSELPEPFRTAVERSALWKWERSQDGVERTGCLATLFPKDNTQDVSFTIWCGNNDGYHLSNLFGLQVALSS